MAPAFRVVILASFITTFSCGRVLSDPDIENNMLRKKVLVTDPEVPKIAFDLLQQKCEVIKTINASREAILDKIAGVHALFWASHCKLDGEILDAAGPQMKTIGTMSVGYDHIDLSELKKRDIKLGHTPDVLNSAVADAGLLLMLAASRRLHEGRLAIENGNWLGGPQWMLGTDLNGSTVGIMGFGRIGQAIAKRLKAFDVKNIYYTYKEVPQGNELGATFVPLDTLISQSDFIVSALPGSSRNVNFFNETLFNQMKNTTVFVNIGRGVVVDQPALIKALKEKKIFAAGLDVMTPEPLPKDHELLQLPNLVLLPHLGSATVDTRNSMAELTVQNILRGLGGEEMITPVSV